MSPRKKPMATDKPKRKAPAPVVRPAPVGIDGVYGRIQSILAEARAAA